MFGVFKGWQGFVDRREPRARGSLVIWEDFSLTRALTGQPSPIFGEV